MGQPTRPTQPSILSGSVNEYSNLARSARSAALLSSGVALWWMLTR